MAAASSSTSSIRARTEAWERKITDTAKNTGAVALSPTSSTYPASFPANNRLSTPLSKSATGGEANGSTAGAVTAARTSSAPKMVTNGSTTARYLSSIGGAAPAGAVSTSKSPPSAAKKDDVKGRMSMGEVKNTVAAKVDSTTPSSRVAPQSTSTRPTSLGIPQGAVSRASAQFKNPILPLKYQGTVSSPASKQPSSSDGSRASTGLINAKRAFEDNEKGSPAKPVPSLGTRLQPVSADSGTRVQTSSSSSPGIHGAAGSNTQPSTFQVAKGPRVTSDFLTEYERTGSFHPMLDKRTDLANGPTRARFLADTKLVESIDKSIEKLPRADKVAPLASAIQDQVDKVLASHGIKMSDKPLRDMALVRGLFRWIANNIAYDIEVFRNRTHTRYNYSAEDVLIRGKSVCEGYANLLSTLGEHVGLCIEKVSGFARHVSDVVEPSNESKTNHAWNIFRTENGEAYILDSTWGAGPCRDNTFYRRFNPHYFCCPAKEIITNRFPSKPEHQLLSPPLRFDEFLRLPCVSTTAFRAGLRIPDIQSTTTINIPENCPEIRITLHMREGWSLMLGGIQSRIRNTTELFLKHRVHVINNRSTTARQIIIRSPERFAGEFSALIFAIKDGEKEGADMINYVFKMEKECLSPLKPFPGNFFTGPEGTFPDVWYIPRDVPVRFVHVVPPWYPRVTDIMLSYPRNVGLPSSKFTLVSTAPDGSRRFEAEVVLSDCARGDTVKIWAYKSEPNGTGTHYAGEYPVGEYVLSN